MRRIAAWILAVLGMACLFGCGRGEQNSCDPFSGEFGYTIEGETCGVPMAATLWVSAPRETEEGVVRSVSMTFSRPQSLSGVTVSCEQCFADTHTLGDVRVVSGDMTVSESALRGLLAPASLLAAQFEESRADVRRGEVTYIRQKAQGNERVLEVTDGRVRRFSGRIFGVWGEWEIGDTT